VERREAIRVLLEHLEDVRAGLRDGSSADAIHLPLMCTAWNSPSYRELERLLPLLRSERPDLAWHLRATFFAPRKRVLACANPTCGWTTNAWASVNFHTHGRRHVAVVPKMIRVVGPDVRPKLVDAAIEWLDERWRGEVFLPDELLPLVGAPG
jgi:hypothetical protein